MLGVNQLDFINYCNALKGNYRKGVHKMETLLENPTHAKEFASNLGGVSVVLGTPVGKEDRNSETLRSMLLASDVANDAVYTWMGQYYEFDSWDELLGDEDRCKKMMANELLWRALSASGVAMGKTVATLAGLSCSAYDDMSAVAASSTAMTAIASSQTAMAAVQASSVAMAAIASSSMATAKFAVGAVGLDPAVYDDMAAVAGSSTAMTAIAASLTAMAVIMANDTALNAVVSSSTAMTAVAASSTAMKAVADNKAAITAIEASAVAKNALFNSPLKTSVSNIAISKNWTQRRSGKIWLISFRQTLSSGNSYFCYHRYTLKDRRSLTCTATQSYSTYRIDRFMDSITNCSDDIAGTGCTYYFIPC